MRWAVEDAGGGAGRDRIREHRHAGIGAISGRRRHGDRRQRRAIGNGTASEWHVTAWRWALQQFNGRCSIAIGYSMGVNGLNAIGIGVFAGANGVNALALGGNAQATGDAASRHWRHSVASAAPPHLASMRVPTERTRRRSALFPGDRAARHRARVWATRPGWIRCPRQCPCKQPECHRHRLPVDRDPDKHCLSWQRALLRELGDGRESAIGIGTDVTASQVDAIAMGTPIRCDGTILGRYRPASEGHGAGGAMALGQGTVSSGVNSVALGVQASATGAGANRFGHLLRCFGRELHRPRHRHGQQQLCDSRRLGSLASGTDSTAVGRQAVASALDATAMRYISNASGQYSTATGANANATATSSTALGQNSVHPAFKRRPRRRSDCRRQNAARAPSPTQAPTPSRWATSQRAIPPTRSPSAPMRCNRRQVGRDRRGQRRLRRRRGLHRRSELCQRHRRLHRRRQQHRQQRRHGNRHRGQYGQRRGRHRQQQQGRSDKAPWRWATARPPVLPALPAMSRWAMARPQRRVPATWRWALAR